MPKKIPTKSIVITGTHLTPAVELIRQLKSDSQYQWDIIYIGRHFNSNITKIPSIESEFIPKLNIKFIPINSGKYDRKYFPNTLQELPYLIKGFFDAFKIISKIKPDIIVSFGGYISVPIIFMSWIKKIPSITHEQTLTNSLTTKINSFFVSKVALSFNNPNQIKTLPKNKIIITGNLLRSEIYDDSSVFFRNLKLRNEVKSACGGKIRNCPIIYITAGNQGSSSINKIIKNIQPKLKNFIIIHQTGKTDYDYFKKISSKIPNYLVFDYIGLKDIGWVFKNADIFISRSGANTCQEIIALDKKSILIPLPKSQQNEQMINALWVQKQFPSSTVIISQPNLTSQILLSSINKLLKQKIEKKSINDQSNFKLLKTIHEIV